VHPHATCPPASCRSKYGSRDGQQRLSGASDVNTSSRDRWWPRWTRSRARQRFGASTGRSDHRRGSGRSLVPRQRTKGGDDPAGRGLQPSYDRAAGSTRASRRQQAYVNNTPADRRSWCERHHLTNSKRPQHPRLRTVPRLWCRRVPLAVSANMVASACHCPRCMALRRPNVAPAQFSRVHIALASRAALRLCQQLRAPAAPKALNRVHDGRRTRRVCGCSDWQALIMPRAVAKCCPVFIQHSL